MPLPAFTVGQNDSGETITATLPADLTGATVAFLLAPISGGDLVVDAAATVSGTPTDGGVSYVWQAADTEVAGLFLASWQVTFGSGEVETFPAGGYTLVQIVGELGQIQGGGVPSGLLPPWFQHGDGSPAGAVVPFQKGALYQDTTNGGLYAAFDVTADDWMQIGGGGGNLPTPGPNSHGGGYNWYLSAVFSDWNINASDDLSRLTVDDPADSGQPNLSIVVHGAGDDRSGRTIFADGSINQLASFHSGVGMFGITPPNVQPATPVTLGDVIALLQSFGMSA